MNKGVIYIIDDEYDVRFTLENIFRLAGYTVKSFATASAALEDDLSDGDSCIVLDLHMPEMGGLEFQELLKDRHIRIPIVIYTGKADVQSTVMAMTDGAYTLLQKPAPNHVLIDKVQNAMATFKESDKHHEQCQEAYNLLDKLSNREFEIAKLIANGSTALDVADKLFISKRTAEAHRASIFNKLHIKSVALLAQLVLLADMILD
jgi:two-component system response regulator FixJ